MDSIRYLRYSIPGWTFLLTFLFTIYVIGGTELIRNLLYCSNNGSGIFSIISVFFASPVVGMLIATLTYYFLHNLLGYKIYFPDDINKYNYIHILLLILLERFKPAGYKYKEICNIKKAVNKSITLSKSDYRNIFDLYQLLIRGKKMPQQLLKYSQRCWSFYWLHLNNLAAIILGIISGWCFLYDSSLQQVTFCKCLLVFLVLVIIYVLFRSASRSREDAINAEVNWILTLEK